MNPVEQKQHKKRTDELEALIGTVESAALDAIEALRISIGNERTHRLKLADEQRGYVDDADRELRRISDERWLATAEAQGRIIAMSEPLRRDLWGRLKWLVVGR